MDSLNNNSIDLSKKSKKHFCLFDKTNSNIPSGGITYIIAFIIPLIIMTALYIAREIYPFGNNCYLRSDMYHQYAPFFSELWNVLHTAGISAWGPTSQPYMLTILPVHLTGL